MAARDEREHQRPAASVPPEGQRPLTSEPGGTERDRETSQRATPKDAALSDPRGYPRARRCADGLNSSLIADSGRAFDLLMARCRGQRGVQREAVLRQL